MKSFTSPLLSGRTPEGRMQLQVMLHSCCFFRLEDFARRKRTAPWFYNWRDTTLSGWVPWVEGKTAASWKHFARLNKLLGRLFSLGTRRQFNGFCIVAYFVGYCEQFIVLLKYHIENKKNNRTKLNFAICGWDLIKMYPFKKWWIWISFPTQFTTSNID